MDLCPHFPVRFLRALPGQVAEFGPEHLTRALPLNNPALGSADSATITYAAYLESIRRFICSNFSRVSTIAAERGKGSIESLDIVSQKHGSDYHPAKLVMHCTNGNLALVVNVAVTERGKDSLERDFGLLGQLSKKHGDGFLPREYVFGGQPAGEQAPDRAGMLMFLGEWLEGFHEFHLSSVDSGENQRMILWDLDHGYHALSEAETSEIFKQAAFILTVFYDLETQEEVFPWHHAAGDFVACKKEDSLEVRLITVRNYAARTVFQDISDDNRSLGLLVFLANLTIRMRLDRLDGVGEVAWAGDECVRAAIQGFLEGLKYKLERRQWSSQEADAFVGMLRCTSPPGLAELFQAVRDSYDRGAADFSVIQEHLADHVFEVYRCLRAIPGDLFP